MRRAHLMLEKFAGFSSITCLKRNKKDVCVCSYIKATNEWKLDVLRNFSFKRFLTLKWKAIEA